MKKKLIVLLVSVIVGITLGYLFILSWILGLLVSKYAAGKSSGEPGRFRSIIFPFLKWRIHLHHWLYSLCLMALSHTIGLYFFSPMITYGALGGVMFQGIYYYNDWYVIAVKKTKIGKKQASLEIEVD